MTHWSRTIWKNKSHGNKIFNGKKEMNGKPKKSIKGEHYGHYY